ncbi:hypothetical protein BLNAU_23328 [Blattamonas nauphoetae]|uniref:Uncharacterized protein n=1 Tax=Blattamonas nauphoetae TaxID=2049346 RepID=A0ABQ9WQI2_9EUKA|nr:hypothetical protein BLNAU_23328 [Blattamonas nauphoetae]
MSHIASLAKTLSDRTYDERSLVIQVTGWAIQEGIETIRLSETFIHQICKPYIVDPLTFFDASFETFVDTSIDLASFLWKEYASKDTPDHFLRNACLIENLLTLRAQILSANRWSDHLIVNDLNVITFSSFTPFGECPALRSLFSILCQPGVTSNGHVNLELLEHVSIVSSHSLPLHFDSPLLAFVRTVHPLTHASHEDYTNELNSQQSLLNLHHAPRFVLKWLHPFHLMTTLKNLLSLSPVQVSLALLTLSRAVDDSSKACEWLVRAGAVDVVVESNVIPIELNELIATRNL